jgi:hypothetical protein
VIQKRWKRVLYIRLLKVAMVRSNQPLILLIVSHSISEGFFRKSSFQYDRLNNYIVILHSIERDGERTKLKSILSLSSCLQKDYPDSWQEIETTGELFYGSILPLVCKTLADSFDFKYNSETGYSCSIRDSNPLQQIPMDKTGSLPEEKFVEKSTNKLRMMDDVVLADAAILVQRTWRSYLGRLRTKRMKEKEAQEKGRKMANGSLKLTTYKKVDGSYYRINLYEKEEDGKSTLKFFPQKVEQRHLKIPEIPYSMNENKLRNSKGKPIVKFLIDSLKKTEDNKLYFDLPKNGNFKTLKLKNPKESDGLATDSSVTNRVSPV